MEPLQGVCELLVLLAELCIITSTTEMFNQDLEYVGKGLWVQMLSHGKLGLGFSSFTCDCNC